jgi:hypothetical protein
MSGKREENARRGMSGKREESVRKTRGGDGFEMRVVTISTKFTTGFLRRSPSIFFDLNMFFTKIALNINPSLSIQSNPIDNQLFIN